MAVTLVEKYNPEWPKWFEDIKAFLGEKVAKACIRIEHVGSTSSPATAFRDYMKTYKKDRERLSALKWQLAEKFDNDKYPYMDGKDAMVKEITEKALKYMAKKENQ